MAIDVKKYSAQLRKLCEDYYFQNISYIEFRMQRNDIFDKIQSEQDVGSNLLPTDDGAFDDDAESIDIDYLISHQD